ncbi:MAG: sulfite exporter TauE/SafE family protein [Acidimicrobiia bacterium]|nr:sulfite exporter TauE/SafE family protein [Acidimicrobiia bacterium]
MPAVELLVAGVAVGVVFGLFGAGGSAFATPVLALLGVPGAVAVGSPLPAMVPAAFAGAHRHLRAGSLDRRIALLTIAAGVPGTILGSLASTALDGKRLLTVSGVMLLAVGARVLLPDGDDHAARAASRRANTALVLGATFTVGLLTGFLANGGGFLLVPLFVVALGLTSNEAAGTSMAAVGALTIPTLLTHWAVGHIDWAVAATFAVGVLPGSLAGARVAARLPAAPVRRAFGIALVAFAAWFLAHQAGWV